VASLQWPPQLDGVVAELLHVLDRYRLPRPAPARASWSAHPSAASAQPDDRSAHAQEQSGDDENDDEEEGEGALLSLGRRGERQRGVRRHPPAAAPPSPLKSRKPARPRRFGGQAHDPVVRP
jgi:hypothetical protein